MKHKKETEDFNTEEPRTPRHTEDFNTEDPRTPRHTEDFNTEDPRTPRHREDFNTEEPRTPRHTEDFNTEDPRTPRHREDFNTEEPRTPRHTEDFNTEDPRTPRHREDFNTEEPRTPRHTGSDGVMISRAAAVVFVLLCVLLLTARIILCATFTQERQQLKTKITNLLTNNMNLTEERQQLLTNNRNLKEERDQLKSERIDLQKKLADGWKCHQSSLYFFSSETKSWTESRRYCREREADLIIINNTEEQDFVKNICGSDHFWIGLTDVEEEGRWKWVDGSNINITSEFWASGEPNDYQGNEDCANTRSSGWFDVQCDSSVKWICEKSILK